MQVFGHLAVPQVFPVTVKAGVSQNQQVGGAVVTVDKMILTHASPLNFFCTTWSQMGALGPVCHLGQDLLHLGVTHLLLVIFEEKKAKTNSNFLAFCACTPKKCFFVFGHSALENWIIDLCF